MGDGPGGSENPIASTKQVLPYTGTEKNAKVGREDINTNVERR